MTWIDDRINRRNALVQLTAATVLIASAAKAQRPGPTPARVRNIDLGRKSYMLEGLNGSGNVLIAIGDDGIIMVDALLASLHGKLTSAITEHSNLPVKCLVNTHFHNQQTGGNALFHRDGAVIVAQDNVRVRLIAGTTNTLNHITRAPRRTRMRFRAKPTWEEPRR